MLKDFALPVTLAARSLDARLAKRMQGELYAVQGATDRIVDHLKGGLISSGFAIVPSWLASIHTAAQTLLLPGRVDLFLQILALQENNRDMVRELNIIT